MNRWLTNRRVVILGLASAAMVAGVGTTASAAGSSDETTAPSSSVTVGTFPAAAKTLDYDFQLQTTGYFCGPAATRMALTAQGETYSQSQLATKLGTTSAGTNSITDVTRVLNTELGDRYFSVEIPGRRADDAQTATFRANVVTAINSGDVVVANIVGTATDETGYSRTFAGGHYVAIVGFADYGGSVVVADSSGKGAGRYEMSTDVMADWIAARGYAA